MKLNRFIMSVLFCIPLTVIALYESQIAHPRNNHTLQKWLASGIDHSTEDEENDPKIEDPSCEEEGEISRVKFEDLVKAFPK